MKFYLMLQTLFLYFLLEMSTGTKYKMQLGYKCICVSGETFPDPLASVYISYANGNFYPLGRTAENADSDINGEWAKVYEFEADPKDSIYAAVFDVDGGLHGDDDLLGKVTFPLSDTSFSSSFPIEINKNELLTCVRSAGLMDPLTYPCENELKPELSVKIEVIE